MRDVITTALRAARRDPKLKAIFNKILAGAQVYALVRPGNAACIVHSEVGGERREYIACFSSARIAAQTLKLYSVIAGNNTATAAIRPFNALKLFFSAARLGRAIYLNPKNTPDEQLFFTLDEVKEFLLGPWAINIGSPADPGGRSRFLTRSRRGRGVADGENTQAPISEIEFERPFTAGQLAEIFGVSENDIVREIAELEHLGALDLSAVSITLNESENGRPRAKATRYYDPVVTSHVGYRIKGRRGDEFRRWHTQLMHDFYCERKTVEDELERAKGRLEEAGRAIKNLEEKSRASGERVAELEARFDQGQDSLSRLTRDLARKDRQIAELKVDLEAASRPKKERS